MAKGISVHVGVNWVNAPGISVGKLKGCENDAREMHSLARDRGFISDGLILNEDATYDRVVGAIRDAATKLVSGDIFFFTFSGHGTRRGTDDIDEEDSKDETLVLHDRLLIDNVLRRVLWPEFREGVRIVAVSDSCHGGGVFFVLDGEEEENIDDAIDDVVMIIGGPRIKTISDDAQETHLNRLKDFYTKLRQTIPSGPAPALSASLLLIGACEAKKKALDGEPNSVFTEALLHTWNNGNFQGSYDDLIEGIKQRTKQKHPPQTPVMTPLGKPLDPEFRNQRPFSI